MKCGTALFGVNFKLPIILAMALMLSAAAFAEEGTSGGGNTGIDSNFVTVQLGADETVKCIFDNSTSVQTCYSEWGKCKGTVSCTTKVSGPVGKEVTWKSTCGGYATTTI